MSPGSYHNSEIILRNKLGGALQAPILNGKFLGFWKAGLNEREAMGKVVTARL